MTLTPTTQPKSAAPDAATIQQPFGRFTEQKTIALTTYRRDGTPVITPVHIAVVGSVAYIRTFDPSGVRRIRFSLPDGSNVRM